MTKQAEIERAQQSCSTELPNILAGKIPVTEALLRELAYWATAPSPKNHEDYDLTKLDTSQVTDMNNMFYRASSFNQPVGDWDVSNVTSMKRTFYMAKSFNQPIGNWDVCNVTDMSSMFYFSTSFNQPIADWDVSNVTDMSRMFDFANSFNQPISDWEVSSATNMNGMFSDAISFRQDISWWNIGRGCDIDDIYDNCPIREEFKALPGRYELKIATQAQDAMTDIIGAGSSDDYSPQL